MKLMNTAEASISAQPARVSEGNPIPSTAISKNTPLTGSTRARRLPVWALRLANPRMVNISPRPMDTTQRL
ncbi:MAG TPA: hypothetical protein PK669_13095 [Methanosarcina thermophila]|nr:hypothetical protein [Methanosarcina thermophila]HPZ21246.1 hypothetical protein [Methanosarcina thermophila]HQD95607.1 hypothetical protein [Methanosarcina thermophila]